MITFGSPVGYAMKRKGTVTAVTVPDTVDVVPLFDPRRQIWSDHFAWSTDGTHIIAKTAIGSATVHALSLNDELRVRSRAIWIKAGYHPPKA